MADQAVQGQWAFDRTLDSTFGFARGVMTAATTDNVQPNAILACERLGATLAICDETIRKVEATILPPTKPAILKFLGATVGFASNDCVTYFGTTQAGVRFLALAAALSTTLEEYATAKALDTLLKGSSTDLTMLPTFRQIRDLANSLEARCHRGGFANSVAGWDLLFRKVVLPELLWDADDLEDSPTAWSKAANYMLDVAPSVEMVSQLVDVFCKLARVGDSDLIGATISLRTALPWVTAFTKWCIGQTPRIVWDDDNGVIIDSNASITLKFPRRATSPFWDSPTTMEISLQFSLQGPGQLITASSFPPTYWSGMIGVHAYGMLVRDELFFWDKEWVLVPEALEYGTSICLRIFGTPTSGAYEWEHTSTPTASIGKTIAAYAYLYDIRISNTPEMLDIRAIEEFPRLCDHVRKMESACTCPQCNSADSEHVDCVKGYFFGRISFLIANAIAISLFQAPDVPLYGRNFSKLRSHRITEVFTTTMLYGSADRLSSSALFEFALLMVSEWRGYDAAREEKTRLFSGATMMAATGGQVTYPALFETMSLEQHGYMELVTLPGALEYRGDQYTRVIAGSERYGADDLTYHTEHDSKPVLGALNLFPNLTASWVVEVDDNGLLTCSMSAQQLATKTQSTESFSPLAVFDELQESHFLSKCLHSRSRVLPEPDKYATYRNVAYYPDEESKEALQSSHIDIVAIDGSEKLRFLALVSYKASSDHALLRGSACLECCLNFCRKRGIRKLIL